MSHSSYATLQDVLSRITRLEIMLGLLIQNTQGPIMSVTNRDLLLNFAGVLAAEKAQADLAPGNNPTEVAHAVEDPQ